jgi:hypothetical protein
MPSCTSVFALGALVSMSSAFPRVLPPVQKGPIENWFFVIDPIMAQILGQKHIEIEEKG